MSEQTIKKCYLVFNVSKTVLKEDGSVVGLGSGLGYIAQFFTDRTLAENAAANFGRNTANIGLLFEVVEAHLTPVQPVTVIRAEATLS